MKLVTLVSYIVMFLGLTHTNISNNNTPRPPPPPNIFLNEELVKEGIKAEGV